MAKKRLDLTKAYTESLSDGQVLTWDAAEGAWHNITPTGGGTTPMYTLRVDETTSFIYVGEALPGTLESAASWRIYRLEEVSGDLDKTWADGNSDFDNIWDDHLTKSYS